MPCNNDYFLSCLKEISEILNLFFFFFLSLPEKMWEFRLSHSSISWKCISLATTKDPEASETFVHWSTYMQSVCERSCVSHSLREIMLHSIRRRGTHVLENLQVLSLSTAKSNIAPDIPSPECRLQTPES